MGISQSSGAGMNRGKREAGSGKRRRGLLFAAGLSVLSSLIPLPASLAQTRLVLISGVAGEPKYVQSFHAWATSLVDAARKRYGMADSSIVWLAEDPAKAPGRIGGKSTKENVERTLDG